MKICLLIINYNGLKHLEAYLGNISGACIKNNISLIITDGQSTDGSIEYLAANGYNYTVTPLPRLGFANNINNGLKYAMSVDSFDYYIISNNDIEINEQLFGVWENVLVNINKIDPKHGLIGFDEVLRDRRDYFAAFRYDTYSFESIKKVSEIPGFFMIIRQAVIATVGFFDEEYFMYGEDNDFFTRSQKAGFTLYNTFLPVLHYSEGSSSNDKLTSWYVYRNAFLYAQKNLGVAGFLRILASFINQIYNPFFKRRNAGNMRVARNGFIYNNYLLIKSLAWNLKYRFKKH
jgi:GT2 family glycosyltransferase